MEGKPLNIRGQSFRKSVPFLIILSIVLFGFVIFFYSANKGRPIENSKQTNLQPSKKIPTEAEIAKPSYHYLEDGWVTYRNAMYGFEITYPEEWGKVRESKDGAGNDYILLNPYDQGDATVIIAFYDANFDIWSYVLKIGNQFNQRTISQERILVNGKEAEYFKITTKDNSKWESEGIFVKGDSHVYHLMMSEASPELTEYEYRKILDSFVVLP